MKIRTFRLSVQTSVWVLASAFCVTSTTGCGANGNFTRSLGSDNAPVAGLTGRVHGGPNPVIGAAVTLYATTTVGSPSSSNNYGYGQAGEVLGTTTTDGAGRFSLTGDAVNCPAGQQAYIVSAGGNTTGNPSNSASLLMAALGPCSGISDSTAVIIDEPTTIAAANALSGFMTVGGATVNISAPANNNGTAESNGATGACTTSGGVTTGCIAAGLAHAFLNAANLVNSTTGVANTSVSSGLTVTATVPQALINTLANSVEACVNSNGDTTTATAPCAVLMTNTTPTAEVTLPTAPTNTLQALLDLALYPSEATGCPTAGATPPVLCAPGTGSGAPVGTVAGSAVPSAATTNLFNVANSNAYYAPALTSAPLDFTIAIGYTLSSNDGVVMSPWGIATDIDDNVYIYGYWVEDNGLDPYSAVVGLASNGTESWSTSLNNSTAGCPQYMGTAYIVFPTRCSVATDTLGNVWVVDVVGLHQLLSTAGGLVRSYAPDAGNTLDNLTVDLGNNVWTAAYTNAAGNSALEELPQGATTFVDVDVGGAVESDTTLQDPAFDSAGNLWCTSSNAAGSGNLGVLLMISSNNSLTSPSFSYTSSQNPLSIFEDPVHNTDPIFHNGSEINTPMIDSSGNMWVGSEFELNEVVSSGPETSGAKNYATAFTTIYGTTNADAGIWEGSSEIYSAMDGDGKIVIDSFVPFAGYMSVYYPKAPSDGNGGAGEGGADLYLNPCYVASGATTCALSSGDESAIVSGARASAVDASGAIWTSFSSGDTLTQILGPGAPTWPQASYKPKALQTNTSGRPY